ncbi:Dodecaprenyl-phosphate galacturonate synthase [Methanosarcinales archaeon]|nr:hypothetical protein [Candidatus Methanoperedens sp.]CAG0951058.1 Dodecaprenyl-phosphate galacturonate synthase [Methanosarcinales archaeon]
MKMTRMRILMLNYEYPPLGVDYFIDKGSIRNKEYVSKYGLQRLAKGFFDLIVISFWQKFSARPIHVFGGLGLLLGISGTLLGGFMGMERLFFGTGLSDRPLFLLAVLMVIIGIQFIVSGILADIMLKVYYGQNERKNYLIEKQVG